MRTTSLTWAQYRAFWQNWCRDYLARSAYWRIDDRPVCAFNNLTDFVAWYGQATFAVMLRYGASFVERETGQRPYLLGVIGQVNLKNIRLAAALPVDGVTGYGLLPNWSGPLVQRYDRLIEERIAGWEFIQRHLDIPFFPVVCSGWDATLRGDFRDRRRAPHGYPFSPIVTGVTPALFGRFLDAAIAFNLRWRPRPNIVFLHAWNEWTESSVIEPSDRFGDGFLREIQRRSEALGSLSRAAAAVDRFTGPPQVSRGLLDPGTQPVLGATGGPQGRSLR